MKRMFFLSPNRTEPASDFWTDQQNVGELSAIDLILLLIDSRAERRIPNGVNLCTPTTSLRRSAELGTSGVTRA